MQYDPPNNTDSDEGLTTPTDMPDDYYQGIRKSGKIRRVVVDKQGCIGARSCAVVAPLAFQLDDDDIAYVPEGHGETEEENIKLGEQT